MNDNPRKTKPHLQQQIGGSWLLWFKHSNRYAVLEPELKKAVDGFLDAEDARDFRSKIKDSKANHELLYSEIEAFLTVSSTPPDTDLEEKTALPFDATACPIATDYRISGVGIRVHYQNEDIKALTHNGIAHYAVEDAGKGPQSQFWLYIKEEVLHLFQDQHLIQAVQKDQVHYIQGKFNHHLISLIHKAKESEWAATLHASTVVYNGKAVLLAGQSGKGKSTLTALLLSQGFSLLADDLTPLHATSQQVYYNPSAISIKKGAFPVISQYFDTFESGPEIFINNFKGTVKFLPQPPPGKSRYPAAAIVLVDYQKGVATQLVPIEPAQVLQDLIPDSWISPDPEHAKVFMQWLTTLEFYQLTYSDMQEAFHAVHSLTTS